MNPEVHRILKKTQAFLRGLEATFDEFITRTVSRGEELLRDDRLRQEPAAGQPASEAGHAHAEQRDPIP
jgi:hypothetical protein